MIYFLMILWGISGVISWQIVCYKRTHDTLIVILKEINLPNKVTQIKIKSLAHPITEKSLLKEVFQYIVKGPITLFEIYKKGSRGL